MLFYLLFKKYKQGTSLVVQWLGCYISTSGGSNSILGQGSKIPNPNPNPNPLKKTQNVYGDFAGGPLHWLNSKLLMQGVQVQFLFRELGSRMLFGMARKILNRKKYKQTCMLIQACMKKKSESTSCSVMFNSPSNKHVHLVNIWEISRGKLVTALYY